MSVGLYGPYGGRYVPETLIPALDELATAWDRVQGHGPFRQELDALLESYAGRPTPLTLAERFAPGKRLYLKREDLLHTGAHKLNNALGQALLARELGKQRIVAETGAGQHGVATATVCARFGLECVVHMGAEDMRRQQPNVERMRLLGAEVRPVEFGTKTLKEATSEAVRDWLANVETSYYLIGSCVGPHPYPEIVAALQSVIGTEAREQVLEAEDRLPEAVVACVGGGSNAIGIFSGFVDDDVRLIGVEAAGRGEPRRRPRRECSTARARRSSPTRTGRSSTRTRSPPASTTRASAPSTRSCATAGAPSTSPSTTTSGRRLQAARTRPRGSSRRSSHPTRWRTSPISTPSSSSSCLSGRGDKDLAEVVGL